MAILDNPFPVFQPAMRVISDMASENNGTTEIQTNIANQYKVGLIIRLDIPDVFGIPEINQVTGTVLEIIDPTTFVVDIDTSRVFFDPSLAGPQYAQCVPIGEINPLLDSATYNVLPYPAS